MIELLVLMVVVGLLMALILPAVMSARGSARRTQCQNNLHNLATAALQETENRGRFPVAGFWGNVSAPGPYHNWVVQIVPWLEQRAIADDWDFSVFLTDPPNEQLANIHIPILACPEDRTTTGAGDLSYAANEGIGWTDPACFVLTTGGGIDLNANGLACGVNALAPEPGQPPTDRDYMFQMGLMFVDNWPFRTDGPIRHHRPATVTDGLTHTVMLAENLYAGTDRVSTSGRANWASPEPWRSMFFVSPTICQNLACGAGAVDYEKANRRGGGPAINSRGGQEGGSPWPSSGHSGGVYFAFADGRVQFVSELVNGAVYAALVSPQGTRIGGPLAQQIISDTDY
jgi:prepilin-type processing-associated H-X9-DG protein